MDSLPAQIIASVIRHEMQLGEEAVWLRDQDRQIPQDNGLYVVVGMVSSIPTANATRMEGVVVDDETIEHQISEVQLLENIQIDIFSNSNESLMRSWEIIAALQSFYCQQLQETNYFKIFRMPRSFIDTSSAEGGSILKRYTLVFACQTWYRKDVVFSTPLGDYYDDFTTRVDDEKTIGNTDPLFDFQITPDTPEP